MEYANGLPALTKNREVRNVTIESIPFNWPYATGKELTYVAEAQSNHHLSGDGAFTKRCQQWIEQQTGCAKALLTHSCTSALDLAAILLDLQVGDEVILPSYTFVSTANAFVLRGAIPEFVDIREDTLNLDERLIEDAITPRTRAIVPGALCRRVLRHGYHRCDREAAQSMSGRRCRPGL